jgi:mono/diheme cytochrome c family protein
MGDWPCEKIRAVSLVGRRIGNYTVERLLGQGAMGSVYVAVHDTLLRKVAVKVILPELAASPELVERFVDEARQVSRLGHPALVQVFDFGTTPEGQRYSIMELLEGTDLARALERAGTFTAARAAKIGAEIADGLAAAHDAGIVHRDLKPENLFLAAGSRGEQVKILDFGIAKLLGTDGPPSRRTKVGAVIGTPAYIAPEQARSSADVDARCDQYSLGVVLYQLLSGTLPFAGASVFELLTQHANAPPPPLRTRARHVPPALEAVVMRCLEKDPASRYPDMRALRDALLASVGAAATPAAQRPRRASRMIAAGVAAAGLLGAGAIAVFRLRGAPPAPVPPDAAAVTAPPPPPAPAAPAKNPYDAREPTVLAAGAAIYASKCARCHGVSGEGDGKDTPPGLEPKSFADLRTLPGALDTYRFEIVRRGVEQGGKEAMPSFAGKLPDDDVWKVVTFLGTLAPPAPAATDERPPPPPASTPELARQGARLFRLKCASCHGRAGKGDGRAREFLGTAPADLTAGVFKRRSTPKGSLPTDEDLFRTITSGMGDGGMPSFARLSPEERWALVAHVKTLAPAFARDDVPAPIRIPRRPRLDDAAAARGRKLYETAGCVKCHGEAGRGDGPRAGDLTDYRDRPVKPTDFTAPRAFIGGSAPEDIYRTLMTGVSGTPMPDGSELFDEEEAWDVVAFIRSLGT